MKISWMPAFLAALLAACSPYDLGLIEYSLVTVLTDKASGARVELGRAISFSSEGYVLQVRRKGEEVGRPPQIGRPSSDSENLIVSVTNLKSDAVLTIENGCYVVTVRFQSGDGLVRSTWKDPDTGTELCFDLKPSRVPIED